MKKSASLLQKALSLQPYSPTHSDVKGALPDGMFGGIVQLSLYLPPRRLCKGKRDGSRRQTTVPPSVGELRRNNHQQGNGVTNDKADFPQTLSWSLHSRCVISADPPDPERLELLYEEIETQKDLTPCPRSHK